MILVAIDPGLRKLGLAVFHHDALVHACTVRSPGTDTGPPAWHRAARQVGLALDPFAPVDVAVIEEMQRDRRTTGAKLDAMLQLQGVGGYVLGMLPCPGVGYKPSQWKGSRPKDVEHDYLREILTTDELQRVAPRTTHDGWDAIGIGAHYLREHGAVRWSRQR